jgi:hypothetical protein
MNDETVGDSFRPFPKSPSLNRHKRILLILSFIIACGTFMVQIAVPVQDVLIPGTGLTYLFGALTYLSKSKTDP